MGIYYNPVDDIIDGRVGTFINTHDYNEAMRQLPHGFICTHSVIGLFSSKPSAWMTRAISMNSSANTHRGF